MTLSTNCVAYWKFDENTGTTAADATGNGNTATLTGAGAAWAASGKINSGLTCASNSGASTATASGNSLNIAGNVSMSAWVKPTSTTNYQAIVDRGNTTRSYSMFLTSANTSSIFVAIGSFTGSGITISSPWVTGSWNHIVVTANGTNILVYLNGSQVGSAASTAGATTGSYHTTIGYDSGFGTNYFAGTIDEVGIWSRALTAAEIGTGAGTLYNNGSGNQYPFSGGGSTTSLFRPSILNGIGSGGPFFNNPIGRSMLGWRPKLVTA